MFDKIHICFTHDPHWIREDSILCYKNGFSRKVFNEFIKFYHTQGRGWEFWLKITLSNSYIFENILSNNSDFL